MTGSPAVAAPRIRVLVVDDHALFRSGVIALLSRQPDIQVVGEAADGLEGVKRAKELAPDIVLMDLHMPGTSGKEAIGLLAEEVPAAKVMMLTVSEDAQDLLDCLRAGATGYLLKNTNIDALIDSLRRAFEGDSVVSPGMTSKLVQGVLAPRVDAAASALDSLSGREREVLQQVAAGASNKEIARRLDLAESTVKIHVQHILRKLHLQSRVQAAVFAVEHGIAMQ
ncbi:MAG: response regulator transcription factor [Burkholderiales bacterium]|nr:response regulator transcription factor [Burkholderiales bacterium]